MGYELGHLDSWGVGNLHFPNTRMMRLRDAMDAMGMLCRVRHRPFPTLPAWVYDEPYAQEVYDHFDEGWDLPECADPKLVKRIETYLDRKVALLEEEPFQPARGIPSYKLSSNDDWLISANEVRSALDAYKASGRRVEDILSNPHDLELWPQWIAWLEESVAYGGFRVW